MTTRSTKHNRTLGLLVPLLSALMIPAGLGAADSAWLSRSLNRGPLRPAFLGVPLSRDAREGQGVRRLSVTPDVPTDVLFHYTRLRLAARDSERFTFCSASDLDLPCRLHSNDELISEAQPRTSAMGALWPSPTATAWAGEPSCTPWLGEPTYGSACDGIGARVVEPSCCPSLRWDGSRLRHLGDRCGELPAQICSDWKNFYSCRGLRDLLLGIGVGAILANTSLDQEFRDWYQERVQNDEVDEFARLWNDSGDGAYVIPAVVVVAAVGIVFDDTPLGGDLAEFGNRTLRAYAVGAPPVVFGQWALGGARPGESERQSRWTPFEFTHAISGHAFIGAVPFITAAKMTDCIWLKGGLYGLSVLPGWARVNRDKHYLSQAILGWWIACLSCTAVDETNLAEKGYSVFPLVSSDAVGMGVTCSW